jgi:hypothetical protein
LGDRSRLPLATPDAVALTRIPTPSALKHASTKSSDSSCSGSGSSSSSSSKRSMCKETKAAAKVLDCAACLRKGHEILDCPLVMSLAFGLSAKEAEQLVAKLPRSQSWRTRSRAISIPSDSCCPVPGDGNCLFSAFACAYSISTFHGCIQLEKRSTAGNQCRTAFLKKFHEFSLSNIAVCDGLGVDAILLDDRYWDSI